MLTTTMAGRTWNFSHAIGRNAAAGNGFTQPVSVAAGPGGVLYVLSRGQEGIGGVTADNKRIGKLTIDQEFISDSARGMIWPVGIALDSAGNLYCFRRVSQQDLRLQRRRRADWRVGRGRISRRPLERPVGYHRGQ